MVGACSVPLTSGSIDAGDQHFRAICRIMHRTSRRTSRGPVDGVSEHFDTRPSVEVIGRSGRFAGWVSRGEILSLHEAIDRFRSEVPAFVATDVVNIMSGMSIGGGSADPRFDATVACASYAEVVKTHARALLLLGMDPDSTEDILITTRSTHFLIRLLDSEYYHGLAIGKDGSLGLARVIMKKYEPLLLDGIRALGG